MQGMLHHVELFVRDLAVSRVFWGWLLERLGYREYQSWDQGISYILDATYIVLVQTEARWLDIPFHRCRSGLNHLAFHADSREFVDQITQELRSRGTTILYEDRHPYASGPDCYSVFFEDPDRLKVEITYSEIPPGQE